MGRRILAFFLGMIFGIVLLFGGLVVAAYVGVTTVKPGDIYPDSDKFLGDLANMTLYDIYMEISSLYKEKLGITNDDGQYFTLGEFLERYHIDPVAAFGKPLPDDLMEVPIFELFGGSPDSAYNQMKASIPFSIANWLTQSVDEEGNLVGGYFGPSAIAKLYAHPMSELFDSDKGVKYVFAEVLLADILTTVFPAEEPTEGRLMWAFGQSSIGKLMGAMGANLMLQFKTDGAFETVGSLAVRELIGGASSYIRLIFGDKIFADLIDDDGNMIIDSVMANLYLGGLLSYERQQIDVSTGYSELESVDGITVLRSEDGTTYAIMVDDEGAYLAKVCDDDEHAHGVNCVEFVWYNLPCSSDDHEHTSDCYVEETKVTGMMDKLSSKRVKELNSLSETIKQLTLYDVLQDDVPSHLKSLQNTKIGELSSAIDTMYIGEFLGYERVEGDDGELSWVQRHDTYVCGNNDGDHTHTDECYLSTVVGMMGKLANEKVKDLNNLGETIKTFTLKDVLTDSVPPSLKSIENTPIAEIGDAMNNMYLGEFLAYAKRPVDDDGYSSDGLENVKQNANGDIIKLGTDGTWYEAVLNCVQAHTHDESCYDFVWYKACNDENHQHSFGEDGCYTAVTGLVGRISRLKMTELSGDRIREEVNETPLKEVINIDNANGLFKELGDVKIGNLSKELDALYVGVAMGYNRVQVNNEQFDGDNKLSFTIVNDTSEIHTDGNQIWIYNKNDGKEPVKDQLYYFYDALRNKYYVAQLNCSTTHESSEQYPNGEHIFTCYGYMWLDCNLDYDKDGNKTDHVHSAEECVHAKGLNAKIANLRIDELSGGKLTKIATSLTMGDLIESEMLSSDNEAKLNIVFDGESWKNLQLNDFIDAILSKVASTSTN